MDEYGKVGIDYQVLDASKRSAIDVARATSPLLALRGGTAVDASRGASAFVFTLGERQLAFVLETLGTKSVITRQWWEATGEDRFADIAVDTVAAIVNDVCSVGALPLVVNAYFATGRSDWHAGSPALASLLAGWQRACELSGATWGGGESPALPGLVSPDDIELAGSCVGVVPEGWAPVLGEELAAGDAIVLVASSGLHTNGASLARAVAADLPEGLATPLPSGRRFGDALLDPSLVYVPLVAELHRRGVRPSYLSHVTGHGLRKLMRAPGDWAYVIDDLPPVPDVLDFLVQQRSMPEREAYGTFNMGAGYAVYVRPDRADDVVTAATVCGMDALVAGHVEPGERRVEVPGLGITFAGDELDLA